MVPFLGKKNSKGYGAKLPKVQHVIPPFSFSSSSNQVSAGREPRGGAAEPPSLQLVVVLKAASYHMGIPPHWA